MTFLVRNLERCGKYKQHPHNLEVFRHEATGVAITQMPDGEMISHHPCVHQRELDIASMRTSGRWKQSDLTVRVGGFVYNLSMSETKTPAQMGSRNYCQCGVCRPVNDAIDRMNVLLAEDA